MLGDPGVRVPGCVDVGPLTPPLGPLFAAQALKGRGRSGVFGFQVAAVTQDLAGPTGALVEFYA
jgi:hypothetical protein